MASHGARSAESAPVLQTNDPRQKYSVNFKEPKEIEKYDPSYDPSVWLDTYLMDMVIAGHTDLLAARYLPLMMEGASQQWINTLPTDIIDSWEEMRDAFIKHFEG